MNSSFYFALFLAFFAVWHANGAYQYHPGGYVAINNTYNNNNYSHHYVVGLWNPTDRLLYRKSVLKGGKLFQYTTKTVSYPPRGVISNATITYIRALDQFRDGSGGYAQITSGGVFSKFVTLFLKSSRTNSPIHFIVEIYGRSW